LCATNIERNKMIKAYAIKGIDGSITSVTTDREALEKYLEANPLYSGMIEGIVEIDYNDEPLSEAGEKLKTDLVEAMTKKGVQHFHMSLGPKFYEKSADERMQFVWDILHDVHNATPLTDEELQENFDVDNYKAPRSKHPQIDLNEYRKEDGSLDTNALRAVISERENRSAALCPVSDVGSST